MKKYIEAEAFKEWIENWFYKHKSYHPYAKTNTIPITELYDILEQMPTADVQEVRHGHWIDVNGDRRIFECSVCGGISCCNQAYCNECGAKMVSKDE